MAHIPSNNSKIQFCFISSAINCSCMEYFPPLPPTKLYSGKLFSRHQEVFRGSICSLTPIDSVLFIETSEFIQFWFPYYGVQQVLPCFLRRALLDFYFGVSLLFKILSLIQVQQVLRNALIADSIAIYDLSV